MAEFSSSRTSRRPRDDGGINRGRWDQANRDQLMGPVALSSPPLQNIIDQVREGNSPSMAPPKTTHWTTWPRNMSSRQLHVMNTSVDPADRAKGLLEKIEEFAGLGYDSLVNVIHVGIHSFVTYPFTIFQRQCQIFPYYNLQAVYAAPWQTISTMHSFTQAEGVYTWWRGWRAQGMYILGLPLVEALLVRLVGLANGGRNRRSQLSVRLKAVITQLLVNGLISAVSLPLISFIIMQSVQNSTYSTYSSDYKGFKEYTTERPILKPDTGTRFSFAQLLPSTILSEVTRNIIAQGLNRLTKRLLPQRHAPSSPLHKILHRLSIAYISSFLADSLLYPLGTVMVRLHCQGLPILVNNVDKGSGVQYVTTFYTGPIDCVQGIWIAEGFFGFYKGFSAVLLQYVVYGVLLMTMWKGVRYLEDLENTARRTPD